MDKEKDEKTLEEVYFTEAERQVFSLIYKRKKVAKRKGFLIGIVIGIIGALLFQNITGYLG